MLARLTDAEALETYLHRAFLGAEELLDRGPRRADPDARRDLRAGRRRRRARGASSGMAHRGRLNVLAHAVGRPYDVDPGRVRGREGHRRHHRAAARRHRRRQVPPGRARASTTTAEGKELDVTLASNPSHLEYVDPVVEGRTRADQTDRDEPRGQALPARARCRS